MNINNVEEENKRLKKELATTKVKLRNSSKDRKLNDTTINKNSFASRILGHSEAKNNSLSRERSNTEKSTAITNKLENSLERHKMKCSVLQTTNDKIVQENAMLRLKRKCEYFTNLIVEEFEKQESDLNKLVHNNKLASNIARKELKILKIYQECAEEVKCCL